MCGNYHYLLVRIISYPSARVSSKLTSFIYFKRTHYQLISILLQLSKHLTFFSGVKASISNTALDATSISLISPKNEPEKTLNKWKLTTVLG